MTIAVDDEVFAAASRRAHLAARRDFGAMLLRRSAA
jgi:Arc/MetJ family transcription regulator